jgi:flagellar FliJ protein
VKRFQFRLESLLNLRKRREEECKTLLGRKNQEILGARQALDRLYRAFNELQATERKKRSEVQSVMELRYSVSYRFKLRQDILGQGKTLENLNSQAVELRNRLIRATQQRRAIELVREQRYALWRVEKNRGEQKFTDEIAQRRSGRAGEMRLRAV